MTDLIQKIANFQAQREPIHNAGIAALRRLLPVALRDTGQSGIVARVLLGLYNGQAYRFDLTELRGLDPNLFDDCLALLRMDYCPAQEVHEYVNDGDAIWKELARRWANTAA